MKIYLFIQGLGINMNNIGFALWSNRRCVNDPAFHYIIINMAAVNFKASRRMGIFPNRKTNRLN